MSHVGIVGAEGAKFTANGEKCARALIRELLADPTAVLVSGGCHLGGIDIWAEEEAKALGREALIFPPKTRAWSTGYKPRNIAIAEHSSVCHSIVVDRYPPNWTGMTFSSCYHCNTKTHIKSGGCWTAKLCERNGGGKVIHVIQND